MKKKSRSLKSTIGIILGFALTSDMAMAVDIFPAGTPVFGRSFSRWSAEWWQEFLSIPDTVNPMLDTKGGKCVLGQRGPVWFLAGTFGTLSGPITRSCSIPEGKALFFPVLNSVQINTPNVCGSDANNVSAATLRTLAANDVSKATILSAKVDGQVIPDLSIDNPNFRVKSTIFDVALPQNNVFDPICVGAGLGDVPGGIYSPSVADGVYVMLKPLPVGSHTVRIEAENSDGLSLDVTYKLKVVPVHLK